MIRRLIVLGATGDLAARHLLPALARLDDAGHLPDGFEIIGVARDTWDTATFCRHAASSLDKHAPDLDISARPAFLHVLRYRQADVTDRRALSKVVTREPGPAVLYLALPPALLPQTVDALAAAGLAPGSRVVVEKPFGTGFESARELNRVLGRAFSEDDVFRVDHFLSKQTVQNILGLRFANRVFEPLWNRDHIADVEVVWDETLGLDGRAGYYDTTGALRDMVQNHLLQVMCLVAIDPPATLNERDFRDRKCQLLRAVRPPSPDEMARCTVRGRYGSGRIGDVDVPAYRNEPGVDSDRQTETFAAVTLFVDSWRWAGVPFRLRTGKALARDRREIRVRFRPVPHLAFGQARHPARNELLLELGPDRLALAINVNGLGDPFDLECIELDHELEPQDLPTYARLLVAVLEGDCVLAIRGDEAEESWRIVEPVLAAWKRGEPPMTEYPAGSDGPTPDDPGLRP